MKYNSYRYIYGPRPENTIHNKELDSWDNGSLIAQPKMNGSNCLIFTNGSKIQVMNRHHDILTNFKIKPDEIVDSLFRGEKGNWFAINGEYMNKSKMDEKGLVFNHKFIIFDILVLNGDYMVGKTNTQRIDILNDLYGTKDKDSSSIISLKSLLDIF